MTLPIEPDLATFMSERPGDEIFAQVKHHFPEITKKSDELQKALVQLIIDDMVIDHALSNALDEVGKVIEYQAQNESVEKPKFFGWALIKDAERVGKMRFMLNLCDLLGLDESSMDLIRAAEVERLWGRNNTEKKTEAPTIKLPNEISGLLKDLAKSLAKGRSNDSGTTNKPTKPRRQRPGANPAAYKGYGQ